MNDLTLLGIDELLSMKAAIDGELKSRAVEELAAIEQRKAQLQLLVGSAQTEAVDELKVRRTRAAGVAKFRNPANPEQTWTGRGKKPGWIGDATDLTPFQIAA